MIGATTLPFTTTIAGSSDADTDGLDPTLTRLAALLAAGLVSDLGEGWDTVRTALGATHALAGDAIVAQTVVQPPDLVVIQTQHHTRPTLYVFRSSEATFRQPWTLTTDLCRSRIEVMWVPGPLDAGDLAKLRHLMSRGIPASVRAVCERGGHPLYDSGKTQFLPSEVHSMHMLESQQVSLQRDGADAPVHCVLCVIELTEPVAAVSYTTDTLLGTDVTVEEVGPTGPDDDETDVDDWTAAEFTVGDPPED